MNCITNIKQIKQLGTILCVGAHPDDETWIAGGLLAAAAANRQRVVVITATKGELGLASDDYALSDMADIRAGELDAALQILGVGEHAWLGCNDGACAGENCDQMAARLAAHVNHIKPDSLLTFGPEGLTGHADHTAVSQWCSQALQVSKLP